MPWYMWVWGVISTLGGIGLCFLGLAGFLAARDHIKTRSAEDRLQARLSRTKTELYWAKEEIAKLKRDNLELTKGANEYGRISP